MNFGANRQEIPDIKDTIDNQYTDFDGVTSNNITLIIKLTKDSNNKINPIIRNLYTVVSIYSSSILYTVYTNLLCITNIMYL